MGMERSQTAIHKRVEKPDLQREPSAAPNHAVVDETVTQINGRRERLYTVDPEATGFLDAQSF